MISYRTAIFAALYMLYSGQQKTEIQLATNNKNVDTLKQEVREHLDDYDAFKKEYRENLVETNEDIKRVAAKIEHVQDNYADQLIKIYHNENPWRRKE